MIISPPFNSPPFAFVCKPGKTYFSSRVACRAVFLTCFRSEAAMAEAAKPVKAKIACGRSSQNLKIKPRQPWPKQPVKAKIMAEAATICQGGRNSHSRQIATARRRLSLSVLWAIGSAAAYPHSARICGT